MKYIILAIVFLSIITYGINKNEKVECFRWQKQAGEYKDFYLTDWQEEQCIFHNIAIK
jgi:hypothetical protein